MFNQNENAHVNDAWNCQDFNVEKNSKAIKKRGDEQRFFSKVSEIPTKNKESIVEGQSR